MQVHRDGGTGPVAGPRGIPKRTSPEEKAFPYPGGRMIFIINQTGKVVGRIEGK